MLVLSRRIDQSIMIGDDIIVKVVGIKGDTVRIGIKAPIDVPVHRLEDYRQINNFNGDNEVKKSLEKDQKSNFDLDTFTSDNYDDDGYIESVLRENFEF